MCQYTSQLDKLPGSAALMQRETSMFLECWLLEPILLSSSKSLTRILLLRSSPIISLLVYDLRFGFLVMSKLQKIVRISL